MPTSAWSSTRPTTPWCSTRSARPGRLSAATRRRLARDAFVRIAEYDASIAAWFDSTDDALPDGLYLALQKRQALRYGENPHQEGARYLAAGRRSWWDDAVQHGGKELSYLNLYDTEAAWRGVQRYAEPACVIVKHANPCGVALGTDLLDAYVKANACDPVSAFGGIIALNGHVTGAVAEAIAPVFTEVVVAPSFDDDALEVLARRKNLRVLSAPPPYGAALDVRSIDGGLLVQEVDTVNLDRSTWKVVTQVAPTDAQLDELAFAWQVCASVSSNAIVLTNDRQAVGIGAGQQNRVDSARIAAEPRRRAGRRWCGRQRCVLPVPRRLRRVRRRRRRGRHPARREHERRRVDRRRRRARHRHGVHRRAPLPSLTITARSAGRTPPVLPVRRAWPGWP